MMDETQRFLRYVIPGLLFATEALVLLSLLRPEWTGQRIRELQEGGGLAVILAGLLASGGLGFLFSVVHHTVHWSRSRWVFWREGAAVIDHRGLIRALTEAQVIQPRSVVPNAPIPTDSITRQQAWTVTTALWHQRVKSSQRIKGANERVWSLVDLMHALGTARVAAISSPVFAFGFAAAISDPAFQLRPSVRFAIALLVSIGILAVTQAGYVRAGGFAQGVIDNVLADALVAEGKSSTGPIPTYVQLRGERRTETRLA